MWVHSLHLWSPCYIWSMFLASLCLQFGNTCYCNSVLQALYFCRPFREQVLSYKQHMRNSKKETLLTCLADLFHNIATQKKKVGTIAPKKFIQRLRKENGEFPSNGSELDGSECKPFYDAFSLCSSLQNYLTITCSRMLMNFSIISSIQWLISCKAVRLHMHCLMPYPGFKSMVALRFWES